MRVTYMDFTTDFLHLRPFINKFREETDRACALLGAALLDCFLEQILRKVLIANAPGDIFNGEYAPLGRFAAKIDIAYALGLIPKDERDELRIVKKIRNSFAHDVNHELSFLTRSISDESAKLWSPNVLTDPSIGDVSIIAQDEVQSIREAPRRRFEVAVGFLAKRLFDRADVAIPAKEPKGITDLLSEQRKSGGRHGQ